MLAALHEELAEVSGALDTAIAGCGTVARYGAVGEMSGSYGGSVLLRPVMRCGDVAYAVWIWDAALWWYAMWRWDATLRRRDALWWDATQWWRDAPW